MASQARAAAGERMAGIASRLAVVAAGLPIVVGAAWFGGWYLFALAAGAALIALHELYRLARALRPLVLAGYAGALGALVGAALGAPELMLGGFLTTFVLAFLFAAVSETRQSTTVAIGTTVLGAAWIGFGLASLILVRALGDGEVGGRDAILGVLFTVFATDTLAYVGGRVAGRHKMTPVMSPGKTWEGLVFGIAAGLLASFFWLYSTDVAGGVGRSLAFGATIVVASVIGDLFESLVKRDLGAKDTGRVLPGHGGILDRIDSLLFAGPAAYFFLLAFGDV
jgi:phosphatidate cytidylyltransferase